MAMEEKLSIDILKNYANINEQEVNDALRVEIDKTETKFIVLDDDPTGVQTVHGISVYTDWTVESIKNGLCEDNKLFYILTNSRGLTSEQTEKIHIEIANNIAKASKETNVNYQLISRSDSTLRGHFPLETKVLKDKVEEFTSSKVDGEIMCPFFLEGGRYTIDNVHYVKEGEVLVPAAMTEFAKDKTFGYTNSNIPKYIEEKTKGEFKSEDVVGITLEEIRNCDYDAIEKKLLEVKDFNKVVVNAIDYCDVKVFSVALYRAMAKGKKFIFRTAAGFVKVVGGISDKPLLTKGEMVLNDANIGGIVVVGSHTQKTTSQLNQLLTHENVVGISFNSDLVLEGDDALDKEVERVINESEAVMKQGKVAVCYTKRTLLTIEGESKEDALIRSVKISEAVQSLVGKLNVTPSFVIAKGGITSSDVGTKALRVKKALVLGQIKPGIPVWQTGEESKFPKTPYIIFPGNVGDEDTLLNIIRVFE